MSKSNERNPNVDSIYLGSGASAATVVFPGLYFRKHSRIKNVWFVDQAGIALSTSNFETITLQDIAGNAYATVTMSGVAAVALTPLALALSAPLGVNSIEADVPAGTMLNVKAIGTGTAKLTLATCLIEWYPL